MANGMENADLTQAKAPSTAEQYQLLDGESSPGLTRTTRWTS
tara:strand:+ start:713 stop:838 length:126 start_codon:yes stop_codon:yes gene_type:complete